VSESPLDANQKPQSPASTVYVKVVIRLSWRRESLNGSDGLSETTVEVTRPAMNTLTAHSRRSHDSLVARTLSKGTVERFSFRFRERPALLFVGFEFVKIQFASEVRFAPVSDNVDTIPVVLNQPIVREYLAPLVDVGASEVDILVFRHLRRSSALVFL